MNSRKGSYCVNILINSAGDSTMEYLHEVCLSHFVAREEKASLECYQREFAKLRTKGLCASLTLCYSSSKSFLNLPSQDWKEGGIALKWWLFLSFQMLQAAIMNISRNKGDYCLFFWSWIAWSLPRNGPQMISSLLQHRLLKTQVKIMCSTVSSMPWSHSRQLWSSPML